jgi:hypothetical protein
MPASCGSFEGFGEGRYSGHFGDSPPVRPEAGTSSGAHASAHPPGGQIQERGREGRIRLVTEDHEHAENANAKLRAAESEIEIWEVTPGRPTPQDLEAMKRLLRSARLHFRVVRSS